MAHPRKYNDADPLIGRLRALCLDLPETFEKEAWGECTFRVLRGSMFAMTDCDHHGSGHTAVWVKTEPMVQQMMVKADPKQFFVPPYMGAKGWVGIRLDRGIDWKHVVGVITDAHAMSGPKTTPRKKEITRSAKIRGERRQETQASVRKLPAKKTGVRKSIPKRGAAKKRSAHN